jgi:nitrate reductase delta subunit
MLHLAVHLDSSSAIRRNVPTRRHAGLDNRLHRGQATGIHVTAQSVLALKALGALLRYPDAELLAALDELLAAIRAERALPRRCHGPLDALAGALREGDLLLAQERFSSTFDRGRATSLDVYEHLYGESRERGAAMARLLDVYRRHGLEPAGGELPDSLPLILEFLSAQPRSEQKAWLGEIERVVRTVGETLVVRHSPYAGVFDALLGIAGARALPAPPPRAETAPEDPRALDAEWADERVTFGRDDRGAAQPVRFAPRRPRGDR